MIKLMQITIHGLHGMHSTFQLADHTFFGGNNGVGKTTVLNAIQWALLGYIPGTDKTNAAIFRHAVGKQMSVSLALLFDGVPVRIDRSMMQSGSRIVTDFEVFPSDYKEKIEDVVSRIELPVFNFTEFAGMTANKLKDWFVNYLPKSAVTINWEVEINKAVEDAKLPPLSKEQRSVVLNAISIAERNCDHSIDVIRHVNDFIKQKISALTADSKRIASTLQSLVKYDGDEEISLATAYFDLSQAKDNLALIRNYDHAVTTNARIDESLNLNFSNMAASFDADIEYQSLVESISAWSREYDEVIDVTKRAEDEQHELKLRYSHWKQIVSSDCCPLFSNINCPYIPAHVARATGKIAELSDRIVELATVSSEGHDKSESIRRNILQAQQRRDDIRRKYDERDRLIKNKQPLPDISDLEIIDPDFWSNEIDRLNRLIGQLENASLFDSLQHDKFVVDSELAAYKVLEKLTGVNGLQTSIGNPFDDLIIGMAPDLKKLMPYGSVVPEFILQEKSNSFSFGILRGDGYIPYDMLSSGEKTLYCIALIAALVRLDKDIHLIMIDDVLDHVDALNAQRIMDWAEDVADIQFILAGAHCWRDTADMLIHKVYNREVIA